MELATLAPRVAPPPTVRVATKEDAPTILQLLSGQAYQHIHVDWFLPGDWLGTAGFVLAEHGRQLHACLAVGAEPPPAAWVRVAAVAWEMRYRPLPLLRPLFEAVLPYLAAQGVSQLGWMSGQSWADKWLPELGFEIVAWLESYVKEDMAVPPHIPNPAVAIRPARAEDLPLLAEIETAAFAPLWRQSGRSLQLGWGQALSMEVAEIDGRVVGYQHSVPTQENCAHLARIAIHPAWQGQGVGAALLAQAVRGYAALGFSHASLNAQVEGTAAHALYTKFGFHPISYRVPVWVRDV